jgi:hypothetical protein
MILNFFIVSNTADYIWRESRSKLIQFIDTTSFSFLNNHNAVDDNSSLYQTVHHLSRESYRQWLDFQSILISLLRSVFVSKGFLFQAMISLITPHVSNEETETTGFVEKLTVLDIWLLLALADTPQYKTKIHTCLIRQVTNQYIM